MKGTQNTAGAPVTIRARIDKLMDGEGKTRAFASVTIGGVFAIHGIRVIEGDNGHFVAMPQESYKQKNGETKYNDIFHPVTAEARAALIGAVDDAYVQALEQQMAELERGGVQVEQQMQ